MKIENRKEKKVKFKDVDFGQAFIEIPTNILYIRTYEASDPIGDKSNCCCLIDGEFSFFHSDAEVIITDAKVVIE